MSKHRQPNIPQLVSHLVRDVSNMTADEVYSLHNIVVENGVVTDHLYNMKFTSIRHWAEFVVEQDTAEYFEDTHHHERFDDGE